MQWSLRSVFFLLLNRKQKSKDFPVSQADHWNNSPLELLIINPEAYTRITRGWFQPISKISIKMGSSSQSFGVNKICELPPPFLRVFFPNKDHTVDLDSQRFVSLQKNPSTTCKNAICLLSSPSGSHGFQLPSDLIMDICFQKTVWCTTSPCFLSQPASFFILRSKNWTKVFFISKNTRSF